jgi:hypothetical protein
VAVKVLRVVLALAIPLVLWFRQDDCTLFSRSVAVPLSILDANLNDVRVIGYHFAFGDREAPIAGFHLDAMIGDAEAEANSTNQTPASTGSSFWVLAGTSNTLIGAYSGAVKYLKGMEVLTSKSKSISE